MPVELLSTREMADRIKTFCDHYYAANDTCEGCPLYELPDATCYSPNYPDQIVDHFNILFREPGSIETFENDPVNHPTHYTDGNIEVADFIEDKKLDWHLGNAVKYISRAGKKDPDKYVQDLKKAIWYLKRRIKLYEGEAAE